MEFRGAASNPHEQYAPSRVPDVSLRLKEHICPVFYLTVHLEVRRHCLSFSNLALRRQRRTGAKGSDADGITDGPSAQGWMEGLWEDVGCGEASGKDQWGLCSPLWSLELMPQAQESTANASLWRRALRGWAGGGGYRRRAPGHCPQCCAESSLRRPGWGAGPRPRFVCGV